MTEAVIASPARPVAFRPLPRALTTLGLAFRGATIGATIATLGAAAVAGQNFHLLGPIGDAALGAGVIALAVALLVVPLRALVWLGTRGLRLVGPPVAGVLRRGLLPVVRFCARPWTAASAFVAAVLVLGREDGPLSVFSALVPFEILIGAAALVGLLIGLARSLRAHRPTSPTGRAVSASVLVVAVVIGAFIGSWAAFPGFGDPVVREGSAALATIPQLNLPDPSVRGEHAVAVVTYGSGTDIRRPEYGAEATWTTPSIDASATLERPDGVPSLYADLLWGFGTDALPINGRAWYVADATEPMPVVLIVHGNHAAGQYSDPGYAYLGEHLASHGLFAVSVDENFLNGDAFHDFGGTEMGVRSWLLLRHLEQLRTWNADPTHELANRLDQADAGKGSRSHSCADAGPRAGLKEEVMKWVTAPTPEGGFLCRAPRSGSVTPCRDPASPSRPSRRTDHGSQQSLEGARSSQHRG